MDITIKDIQGNVSGLTLPSGSTGCDIRHLTVKKEVAVEVGDFYVSCNGRLVGDADSLTQHAIYHIIPRLPGGKGGFGSMLRALGAQIEKTTNREACRDLSGRRMRDINNEKKLKEWVSKKVDTEKEREERRKARLERHIAKSKPKFNDPKFMQQKSQVAENLEDALTIGLAKASASAGSSGEQTRKRKADTTRGPQDKKMWLGVDIEDISDISDSDDGTSSGKSENQSEKSTDDNEKSTSDSEQAMSTKNENNINDDANNETSKETKSVQTPSKCKNGSELNKDNTDPKGQETVDENKADGLSNKTEATTKESQGLLSALKNVLPKADDKETDDAPVNLDDFTSAAELETVGLNRLKLALMEKGLKCGGTLEERAQRLFSVKGLNKDQIDPALFAKPSKGKGKGKKTKQ